MNTNPILAGFLAAALGVGLAACGGDPTKAGSDGDSKGDAIVVGSAAFGESEILAEIYAGALNADGIEATTRLDIDQREAYIGAIKEGSIDLFPEYTGNLLLFLDPNATATAPDEVNKALEAALPKGLDILEPSAAEDKDSLNVTAAFAKEHDVTSIADLAEVDGLKLAANPEFKTRAYGIPGLEKLYGITDIAFTAISDGGGPATLKALTSGKVDVADIYSTTPSIAANNLVTLEDPKNLIAAQNVVPLIREDATSEKVAAVLDEVSEKLTTEALLELNTALAGPSKPSAAKVAEQWLKANGFA
ncbi:ABC transporter substrate-binding protein [Nocardioides cavernaquae]|uniref:ABC transporter substrate-binding protein n=1 Tax=Nocardioides cavernaquae TaxID=2321396 RepID=A0A3A5H6T4_9ACTN|nr:ABC transporter substrate-binding protein [Nocardioides cavernaquae]RJS45115.1 ABC transporter substrate-binding protein [Nocardioides cavernaquae]